MPHSPHASSPLASPPVSPKPLPTVYPDPADEVAESFTPPAASSPPPPLPSDGPPAPDDDEPEPQWLTAAAAVAAAEQKPQLITALTVELLADDAALRSGYPVTLDLSASRFCLEGSVAEALSVAKADVLRTLQLDGNALRSLDGIDRFSALRSLSACRNTVAAAAPRCTRLQELSLGGNRLRALPGLAGCPSLRTLDLDGNQINGGYEQLRHTPKLARLDLRSNQVGLAGAAELLELGRGLRAVPRLATLELEGNPLFYLPQVHLIALDCT